MRASNLKSFLISGLVWMVLHSLQGLAQFNPGQKIYLNNISVDGKDIYGPGTITRVFQNKVQVDLEDGRSFYVGNMEKLLPLTNEHRGFKKGDEVYIDNILLSGKNIYGPAKVREVYEGKVTVETESGGNIYYISGLEKLLKKEHKYMGIAAGDRVYLKKVVISGKDEWGPATVKKVYRGKFTIETDTGKIFYITSNENLQKGAKSTHGIKKGDHVFIDHTEVSGNDIYGPALVKEVFEERLTVEMEKDKHIYYLTDFSKILPEVNTRKRPVTVEHVPANATEVDTSLCQGAIEKNKKKGSLLSWIKKKLLGKRDERKVPNPHTQLVLQDPPPIHSVQVEPSAPPAETMVNEESSCCKVCMDANINTVINPCGHMGTCKSCADELKRKNGECPFCRGKIDSVIQVYRQ